MIAHGKDIKVFTGNSNPKLAQNICQELGIPLGDSEVGAFSDGENFASIYETVRGSDVFVVQSTCSFRKDDKSGSVNDALMELLIMIDPLRREMCIRDRHGAGPGPPAAWASPAPEIRSAS